jgi:hypothetical protein
MSGMKLTKTAILGTLVLSLAMISALGLVPGAAATTTTIMDSASCASIGGTWAGTTCTLATSYTNAAGNTIEIPSGTTLAIGPAGTIINDGSIKVDAGGIVTITSDNDFYGIENTGTITNAGTINLDNTAYYSIWNAGAVITNTGTINIGTSGAFGTTGIYSVFYDGVEPTITNSGTINVQNTGSTYGIESGIGIFDNTAAGVIAITNSGELGIYSISTTFTDAGKITVFNTGAYGIDNNGPMTVSGTLTVGPGADAVLNQDTITQECGGIINGPGTIADNPYTPATNCPAPAVPQFPSAGFAPVLLGLLVPAFVILSRRSRKVVA